MHGGDVYTNEVLYDFSVNLNPLGMPAGVRRAIGESAALAGRYPDPAYCLLREEIGRHYGVDPSRIVCGNGASELIMAVCRAFLSKDAQRSLMGESAEGDPWKVTGTPARALLLVPGFTGYRRALEASGAEVVTFPLRAENNFVPGEMLERTIMAARPALVLLANPSNPVGTILPVTRMTQIAQLCDSVGAVLCVDECFMELTGQEPQQSMISHLARNVVVLRAVTKTYAIPGVRLGFAFCGSAQLQEQLAAQLPEWNISSTAQAAGIAALHTDPQYLAQAVQLVADERACLTGALRSLGFDVYPSQAPYMLFYAPDDTGTQNDHTNARNTPAQSDSHSLYQELLRQKILIRDCSDYEGLSHGWYRIAVKKHEENEYLIARLRQMKK